MNQHSRETTGITVCLAIALLSSFWVASIGWSHAISDSYGWRQAETAIRAYFIEQGGPWLSYETPVLGPPWRLPHEFPAYQVLVAGLARFTSLKLEPAGRAVSLGFFYVTVALVYLLLGEFRIAPRHRVLVAGLWLVSPLYLFWSRTFMIESTALAFSVAFLTFALRFFSRSRPLDAIVALVAGSLAFAVKPPTLIPFICLAGVAWMVQLHRGRYRLTLGLAVSALLLVVPLALGRTWHQHADALKLLNPLGWGWTSDAMWRDWVLGPPGTHAGADVRLASGNWRVLWIRTIPESVGHFSVAVAALTGVLLARRRRVLFCLALAAFLFHFVAFMPLHLSHAYYQYAMGLFLVGATSFSVVALLEAGGRLRYAAWFIVGLMGLSCGHVYMTKMLPVQRHDAYRRAWFTRLASELAARTQPSDVLVGFGLDWNPEVPYYAKRRALMWPGWGDWRADSKDVAHTLAQLEGWRVGALFNCSSETPEDTVALFRRRLDLEDAPALELPTWSRWQTCVVYTPRQPAKESRTLEHSTRGSQQRARAG
jgi:hypothetical protein